MSSAEPENVTLELHIRLNGQRWTLVADEIIEAARGLGVTVTESRLSRCLNDSASCENRKD